ncbi:MAG: anti-sigma factor family protein [Chloroflexota bacterium]
MNCRWKEETAYRFADGSLELQARDAFAGHLEDCPVCSRGAAEAGELERTLRSGIVAVAPPATLASRVANAVAAEREGRRSSAWLPFRERPLPSPLAAALVALLLLCVATVFLAPGAVMAVVQRALVFIPGLGINAVDEGNLVAVRPVVLRQGGVTFTVEALLSDGKQTKIEFAVAGLPGGKEGWQGQGGGKPRPPFLRDGSGRQYAMVTGHHGVAGSPQENRIEGGMTFPALPGDLRSIDLVVPVSWLVPPAALPGAETQEWIVSVPLVHPAQSGLPQATAQSASQAVRGVTLRVAASNVGRERTVVLLEGEAEGQARPLLVGRVGGNPAEAALLRDDRGRSYRLIPQGNGVIVHGEGFRQDLYFEPLAPGARQLTLEVPAVQVQERGEASFTVPLAWRRAGESFALDRTLTLGGHRIYLKSATLSEESARPAVEEPRPEPKDAKPARLREEPGTRDTKATRLGEDQGQRWLYLDVDLGPAAEGRTLSAFNVGGSWSASYGRNGGTQLDRFGVPVDPGAREVTIHLDLPLVVVEGPWKLTFSVTSTDPTPSAPDGPA